MRKVMVLLLAIIFILVSGCLVFSFCFGILSLAGMGVQAIWNHWVITTIGFSEMTWLEGVGGFTLITILVLATIVLFFGVKDELLDQDSDFYYICNRILP